MSINRFFIVLILASSLFGCFDNTSSNIGGETETGTETGTGVEGGTGEGENKEEVEKVTGMESIILEYEVDGVVTRITQSNSDDFIISCPKLVVCDENSSYRAHVFDDDNVYIYMSFSPDLVTNYSLTSLVEKFNYLNISLKFPEYSTENTDVYFSTLNPLRVLGSEIALLNTNGIQLDLIEFENGKLRGEIKGIITNLTHRTEDNNDVNCITGDILGICYDDELVEIPFSLHFNLLVEQ